MSLPFTPEQFFGLFADYNRTFGPVIGLLWVASVGGVYACWRDPLRQSHLVSAFLALLWMWTAVVYHAVLFTRINPAAWLFAGLFLLQAILFVRPGPGGSTEYFSAAPWRRRLGLGLALYALAYPFLNMAAAHPYPATPTFGVPCPTTLLTIGLLVSMRSAPPLSLSIVPLVWSMVGGSAATLFDVWPDYALLAAGVLLAGLLVADRARSIRWAV